MASMLSRSANLPQLVFSRNINHNYQGSFQGFPTSLFRYSSNNFLTSFFYCSSFMVGVILTWLVLCFLTTASQSPLHKVEYPYVLLWSLPVLVKNKSSGFAGSHSVVECSCPLTNEATSAGRLLLLFALITSTTTTKYLPMDKHQTIETL